MANRKFNVLETIIIAHGYWGRGGAEIGTMYLIASIVDEYDVYIISRGGWNLKELNKAAGTKVRANKITMLKPPMAQLLRQTKAGAIWHAFFLRYCRHIAPKYDIKITASQTIGWGMPAIHFLTDVVWNSTLKNKYEQNQKKNKFLKILSSKIGRFIAGKALYELHEKDAFIANSEWTAKLSAPYTTTKPIVISPPVVQEFETIPWHAKSNDFVSLGRISPEKRIEDAIKILLAVRKMGFVINYTILGQFGNDDYSRRLLKLVKKHSNWIKALGPVYGAELKDILPTFKYGINTCTREAFGISTAEMMKAGVLPFVPFHGAQSELVKDKHLIFNDQADAVSKITTILSSFDLQTYLHTNLDKNTNKFSLLSFKEQILILLKDLLKH